MSEVKKAADKILDLSDLFGKKSSIIVKYPVNGKPKDFELLDPRAISPKDFVSLDRILKNAAKLEAEGTEADDEMNAEEAIELESLYDQAIALLSPKLAEVDLPFMAKIKIILFYSEQIRKAPLVGSADPKEDGPEEGEAIK